MTCNYVSDSPPFVLKPPHDDDRFRIFINHLCLGQLATALAVAPSKEDGTLAGRYDELLAVLDDLAEPHSFESANEATRPVILSDGTCIDSHIELMANSIFPSVESLREAAKNRSKRSGLTDRPCRPVSTEVDHVIHQLALSIATQLGFASRLPLANTSTEAYQSPLTADDSVVADTATLYSRVAARLAFVHRFLDELHVDELEELTSSVTVRPVIGFSRFFAFFDWVAARLLQQPSIAVDGESAESHIRHSLVMADKWIIPFRRLWITVRPSVLFDDQAKEFNSPSAALLRGVGDAQFKYSKTASRTPNSLCGLHAVAFAAVFLAEEEGGTGCPPLIVSSKDWTTGHAAWLKSTIRATAYAIVSNSVIDGTRGIKPFRNADLAVVASYLSLHGCTSTLSAVLFHANIAVASTSFNFHASEPNESGAKEASMGGLASLPARLASQSSSVVQRAWYETISVCTALSMTRRDASASVDDGRKVEAPFHSWPEKYAIPNVLALAVVAHLARAAVEQGNVARRLDHCRDAAAMVPIEGNGKPADVRDSTLVSESITVARTFLSLPAFEHLKLLVAAHCYLFASAHFFRQDVAAVWSPEEHRQWLLFLLEAPPVDSASSPSSVFVRDWLKAAMDVSLMLADSGSEVAPQLMNLASSGVDVLQYVDRGIAVTTNLTGALRQLVMTCADTGRSTTFMGVSLVPQLAALEVYNCGQTRLNLELAEDKRKTANGPPMTFSDSVSRLSDALRQLNQSSSSEARRSADAALKALTDIVFRCNLSRDSQQSNEEFFNARVLEIIDRIRLDLELVWNAVSGALAEVPQGAGANFFTALRRRVCVIDAFVRQCPPNCSVAVLLTGLEAVDIWNERAEWLLNASSGLCSGPVITPCGLIAKAVVAPAAWLLDRAAEAGMCVSEVIREEFRVLQSEESASSTATEALDIAVAHQLCGEDIQSMLLHAEDAEFSQLVGSPGCCVPTDVFPPTVHKGIGEALQKWTATVCRAREALSMPLEHQALRALISAVEQDWSQLLRAANASSDDRSTTLFPWSIECLRTTASSVAPLSSFLHDVLRLAHTFNLIVGQDNNSITPRELLQCGWTKILECIALQPIKDDVASQLSRWLHSAAVDSSGGGFSATAIVAQLMQQWNDTVAVASRAETRMTLFRNTHLLLLHSSNEYSVRHHATDSTWNRSEATMVCCMYILSADPSPDEIEFLRSVVRILPDESQSTVFQELDVWVDVLRRVRVLESCSEKALEIFPSHEGILATRRALAGTPRVDLITNQLMVAQPIALEFIVALCELLSTEVSLQGTPSDRAQRLTLHCVELLETWEGCFSGAEDDVLVSAATALLAVAPWCTSSNDDRRRTVEASIVLLRRVGSPTTKLLPVLVGGMLPGDPVREAARRAFVALVPYETQKKFLDALRLDVDDAALNGPIETELQRLSEAQRLRDEAAEASWTLPSPVPFVAWTIDYVASLHEALVKAKRYDGAFLLVTLARAHCNPPIRAALESSDLAVSTHVAMALAAYSRAISEGADESAAQPQLAFMRSVAEVAREEISNVSQERISSLEKCRTLVTWRLVQSIASNRGDMIPSDIAATLAFRTVRFAVEARALRPIFGHDKLWFRTLLGTATLAALQDSTHGSIPRAVLEEVRQAFPLREYGAAHVAIIESLLRCGRLDLLSIVLAEVSQIQCDDVLGIYASKALEVDSLLSRLEEMGATVATSRSAENPELARWARDPSQFVLSLTSRGSVLPPGCSAAQLAQSRREFSYPGSPSLTFAIHCYRLCRDKAFAVSEMIRIASDLFDQIAPLGSSPLCVASLCSIGTGLTQFATTLAESAVESSLGVGHVELGVDAVDQCRRLTKLFGLASRLSQCGGVSVMSLASYSDAKMVREHLSDIIRQSGMGGDVPAMQAVAVDVASLSDSAGGCCAEAGLVQQRSIASLIDLGLTELALDAIAALHPQLRGSLLPDLVAQLEFTPVAQPFAAEVQHPDGRLQLRSVAASDIPELVDRRRRAVMRLLHQYGSTQEVCSFALRNGNVAAAVRVAVTRGLSEELFFHLIVQPAVAAGRSKVSAVQEALSSASQESDRTPSYVAHVVNELAASSQVEELHHWQLWQGNWLASAISALTLAVSPPTLCNESPQENDVPRDANRRPRAMLPLQKRQQWLRVAQEHLMKAASGTEAIEADAHDVIRVANAELQLIQHCCEVGVSDEQSGSFTLFDRPPPPPVPIEYFVRPAQGRARSDFEASASFRTLELLMRLGTPASASFAVGLATTLDLPLAGACVSAARWANDNHQRPGVLQQVICSALSTALVPCDERNCVYAEVIKIYVTKHRDGRMVEAEALRQQLGSDPCPHKRMALMWLGRFGDAHMDALREKPADRRSAALAEILAFCHKIKAGVIKLPKTDMVELQRVEAAAQRHLADNAPHIL